MKPEDYLTAIERETRALAVAAGNLDAPVPTCGDWTMRDLVLHVGSVHRWAAGIVRDGATERVRREAPPDGVAPVAWLREGAELCLGALRTAGPDAKAWGWAGDGTVAFWFRRIAQETLVHRVDAELATGGAPRLHAELAADGIDELLTVLLAAPHAAERMAGSGETLHLHRTDGDGEWLVTRSPTGVEVEAAHAKGDAALRGSAAALFLWLWGRVPATGERADGRLEVHGDTAVLEAWTASFPL